MLFVPYAAVDSFEEIGLMMRDYRRGLAEAGIEDASGMAAVALHTHVAPTDALARERAASAFDLYVDTRLYARKQVYADIIASGLSLFGSPRTVADKLARLADMGLDHVMSLHNFGLLSQDLVLDSMRGLMEEAMPLSGVASPPSPPEPAVSHGASDERLPGSEPGPHASGAGPLRHRRHGGDRRGRAGADRHDREFLRLGLAGSAAGVVEPAPRQSAACRVHRPAGLRGACAGRQPSPSGGAFAQTAEDRYAGLDWYPGHDGLPVFDDCVARFECATRQVLDAGDHAILIGRSCACTCTTTRPARWCSATARSRRTEACPPEPLPAAGAGTS